MTDYSQSGEQDLIVSALNRIGLADVRGRFLDIGAGDPFRFSNSRRLAELGWGGVVVEPAAWAFDRLVDAYRGSAVAVCQAVVTAYDAGLVPFYYARDDHVSTTRERERDRWASQVPFAETVVAAVTLPHLLDVFGLGAAVVSIDAEGRTSELVEAYQRHRAWEDVRVIVYEHETNGPKLGPPFELVGSTPNNLVYARLP